MALSILQNVAVQSAGAGSTTVAKAFPSALTSGSLIVALVTAELDTATATAADGTNGSYGTAAADVSQGAFSHSWAWTKANTATGTPTVTITFSVDPGPRTLKLYEIGEGVFDVAATLSALDGVPASLDITPATANEIILMCVTGYPPGFTVDSGYTAAFTEYGGANGYHWGEYIADAGAASAKHLTFGLAGVSGRHYASAAVAVKAAVTSVSVASRRLGLSSGLNSAEVGRGSGNLFRKRADGLLVPAWSI